MRNKWDGMKDTNMEPVITESFKSDSGRVQFVQFESLRKMSSIRATF